MISTNCQRSFSRGNPVARRGEVLPRVLILRNSNKSLLSISLTRDKRMQIFGMPKRTYSEAFSFVISSLIHSAPVLTMESTATLPSPDPTTPDRRFVRTNFNLTPNKFAGTFAPSSQPVESTQRALRASLTGNIVFANEERSLLHPRADRTPDTCEQTQVELRSHSYCVGTTTSNA